MYANWSEHNGTLPTRKLFSHSNYLTSEQNNSELFYNRNLYVTMYIVGFQHQHWPLDRKSEREKEDGESRVLPLNIHKLQMHNSLATSFRRSQTPPRHSWTSSCCYFCVGAHKFAKTHMKTTSAVVLNKWLRISGKLLPWTHQTCTSVTMGTHLQPNWSTAI